MTPWTPTMHTAIFAFMCVSGAKGDPRTKTA